MLWLLIIGFLLVVRFIVAPCTVLMPEEAYYWMYSKYPSLGYLDHPPMVAWLIAAGTSIFGDTEFGVRFSTCVLSIGSTWLCYRLAADWSGRAAGMTAALLFSIAPVIYAAGFLAMPDAPLIFFWLLALVAITRAYMHDSLIWWLIAGLATGLGFQAKYSAAAIAGGALLFLMSDARGRRMLGRPRVWLAAAVALLVASPVIWWNAQHDWASFRFQFVRRASEQSGVSPLKLLASVGTQILVLSPLIFVLVVAALGIGLRRFKRDHVGRWRFAVCFSVPWLAVCLVHGLSAEIRMNWPIPAYLSLLPLAAVLLRGRVLPLLCKFPAIHTQRVMSIHTSAVVVADLILILVVTDRMPFVPAPSAFMRWDRVSQAAEAAEESFHAETGSDPFIIADGRYNLASELAFYMRDPRDNDWRDVVPFATAIGGGLNYVNWRSADEYRDRNAIFLTTAPNARKLAVLRAAFETVDSPRALVTVFRGGDARQVTYWVVRCRCFLGVPDVFD